MRVVLKTAPLQQWNVARELRERIKDRFDELHIEIPFPQRVVWMRQGEPRWTPTPPGDAAKATAGSTERADQERTGRHSSMTSSQLCLVTGATGYVGGRLVPELLAAGHRVRVMVRDKSRIDGRDWSDDVEVAVADATDADAVRAALEGVDVAYYLLHSIGQGKDFAATEERIAQTFAGAAAATPESAGSSTSAGWRRTTRS